MALAAAAPYGWHAVQVWRAASALRQRAEALAQEGNLVEATACLSQYLQLRRATPTRGFARRNSSTGRSRAREAWRGAISLYQEALGASRQKLCPRRN